MTDKVVAVSGETLVIERASGDMGSDAQGAQTRSQPQAWPAPDVGASLLRLETSDAIRTGFYCFAVGISVGLILAGRLKR